MSTAITAATASEGRTSYRATVRRSRRASPNTLVVNTPLAGRASPSRGGPGRGISLPRGTFDPQWWGGHHSRPPIALGSAWKQDQSLYEEATQHERTNGVATRGSERNPVRGSGAGAWRRWG